MARDGQGHTEAVFRWPKGAAEGPEGPACLERSMLVKRKTFAVLTLASVMVAGCLTAGNAEARGKCASGQILRVSSGACVSREAAIEQGIIGGKRQSQPSAAKEAPEADTAALADPELTAVEQAEPSAAPVTPSKGSRRQAQPLRQQQARSEPALQPSSSGVRIEVLRTEPRPTPAILTPTWPYGELAAFPRRVTP
jgi:hypothetical protein